MVALLLGMPGCHLCHDMAGVARPVLEALGVTLVDRDVRDDPETRRLYRLAIPVLVLDGAEIARTRVTAEELRARMSARGL